MDIFSESLIPLNLQRYNHRVCKAPKWSWTYSSDKQDHPKGWFCVSALFFKGLYRNHYYMLVYNDIFYVAKDIFSDITSYDFIIILLLYF